MLRIAIFPGSFDPITKGHESIVKRAIPLFDKIIVSVGINSTKSYCFSLEQRLKWLQDIFEEYPTVEVDSYQMLTVEYAKKVGASTILRGLRNTLDFNYEKNISQMNAVLTPEIETVFLITTPELAAINATIVREIYKNGGDIAPFVPEKLQL